MIGRAFVNTNGIGAVSRQHAVLHPGNIGVADVVGKTAYSPRHDIIHPVVELSANSVTNGSFGTGMVKLLHTLS